jgi:hypothetical protein
MFSGRLIMQPDSRKEEQAGEPRKDVKERKPRFQIVKLEERIAPGGGNGVHSRPYRCGYSHRHCL